MKMTMSRVLFGIVVLGALVVAATAQDCASALNGPEFAEYSAQRDAMMATGVASETMTRNSLTLLLIKNGAFSGYASSKPEYTTQMLADVLRYHVLLTYFDSENIKDAAALNADGVVTTLYQTTGRASGMDGFVNVTYNPTSNVVTVMPSTPGSTTMTTVVSYVKALPYNCSFIEVSNVLEPVGLAAAQLAPTAPPTVTPTPAPMMMGPVEAPMEAPMSSPMAAPMESPMSTPMESPMSTPMESPVETPAETPDMMPPMPEMEVPAMGPASPVNAASCLHFNIAALAACIVAIAFIF